MQPFQSANMPQKNKTEQELFCGIQQICIKRIVSERTIKIQLFEQQWETGKTFDKTNNPYYNSIVDRYVLLLCLFYDKGKADADRKNRLTKSAKEAAKCRNS